MTQIQSRLKSVVDRERWLARGATFVAKARATKVVWFPPRPVDTGVEAASTAKKVTGGATKKTIGAAKKASGAAKKASGAAKKTGGAAKKTGGAAKKANSGTTKVAIPVRRKKT